MPTDPNKTPGPRTGKVNETTDNLPPATGQNVDAGLVAGLVTVDPDTADGRAAKAARDGNASKETEHEDGTIEVTHGALGDTTAEKVAAAKRENPSTIANKKGVKVGEDEADVQ